MAVNVEITNEPITIQVTDQDTMDIVVEAPGLVPELTLSLGGVQGASWEKTFESIAQNLDAYDVIGTSITTWEGNVVEVVKTFDSGSGTTITVTLNLDVDTGLPTTKVLSGDGLPAGIATTCTYDFSEGTDKPPKKGYS